MRTQKCSLGNGGQLIKRQDRLFARFDCQLYKQVSSQAHKDNLDFYIQHFPLGPTLISKLRSSHV